jgi:hypothetical protein
MDLIRVIKLSNNLQMSIDPRDFDPRLYKRAPSPVAKTDQAVEDPQKLAELNAELAAEEKLIAQAEELGLDPQLYAYGPEELRAYAKEVLRMDVSEDTSHEDLCRMIELLETDENESEAR